MSGQENQTASECVIVHASGAVFPLHECRIVSGDGRTVADLRQNGYFTTRDFFEDFPAYIAPDDIDDLRPHERVPR